MTTREQYDALVMVVMRGSHREARDLARPRFVELYPEDRAQADKLASRAISPPEPTEGLRAALISARTVLISAGFVGPGSHGAGDSEINAIDAALQIAAAPLPAEWVAFYEKYRPSAEELKELVRRFEANRAMPLQDGSK